MLRCKRPAEAPQNCRQIDEKIGLQGFEPWTSSTRTRRSTKLSHSPKLRSKPRGLDGCGQIRFPPGRRFFAPLRSPLGVASESFRTFAHLSASLFAEEHPE